jgi:hypothetical protein
MRGANTLHHWDRELQLNLDHDRDVASAQSVPFIFDRRLTKTVSAEKHRRTGPPQVEEAGAGI